MKTKRRRSSFCLAATALSLLTLRVGQEASPINHQISLPAGMSWCDDGMINGLFTQVNILRSQNGVAALSMNTLGMKDAEIRATQFASYITTRPPAHPDSTHIKDTARLLPAWGTRLSPRIWRT